MRASVTTLSVSILLLLSCSRQEKANTPTSELGEIKYHYSISPAARANFDTGLLFLHSFQYEDSREAFQAAQKDDENEMMAYWGEAMTHYRALWGLQDLPAGRAVMAKLGTTREERLSKMESELEKEFWEGVEILYGKGEFLERNDKYAQYMKSLHEKYPDDLEVASFYSLGLIWAASGDTEQEYYDLASDIADGVINANPTHPGALHYKIHSNDDPAYAKQALEAANAYAKVAPSAAHALHMPSHIYVALGMWNEVVASNIDAYGASVERVERKGLSGKERDYHNMAWLHYGYLQQGRYDKAVDLLNEMMSYYADSTHSNSYLIMMQNEQRIESGIWPSDIQPIDVDYSKLGLEHKASQHFFRSLLAYDKKDAQTIEMEIQTLTSIYETSKLLVTEDGIALCSSGQTRYAPNRTDLNRTQVILHQMQALIAMIKNDDASVNKHLQEATQLEASLPYDSGPPFIAYPSFEQYGDWLLSKDRAEEALIQFDKSLTNRTNRSKALQGKSKALTMLNRSEEAADVNKILAEFWKGQLIAMN